MFPTIQINPYRTIVKGLVPERSSSRITATLKDDFTGEGIPLASFTEFLLTVYRVDDQAIVNGRNKVNILNANGVTITSAGSPLVTTLDYQVDPADHSFLGTGTTEKHIMLFEWKWTGGKAELHEVLLTIGNIAMRP